jgi:hypothetical protein
MSIDAAYAAYTDACTFFLDENGVCVRVILTRRAPDDITRGGRTRARAADRCVGAQYVASIDRSAAGGLVSMPQAGAPMLYAYLEADGRIGVIRTGPLVRFENLLERTTLRPDRDEDRSGAYESCAAQSVSAPDFVDEADIEDDDESAATTPRRRPLEGPDRRRQLRPPAAPWQALRRAATLSLEPARPARDSAPTWKDVQPPGSRRVPRAASGANGNR